MPRASDYLLPGYTYHLTHRCVGQRFLLHFAKDRANYRNWLLEGSQRHKVPIYGFCITENHVHVLAHADSQEGISDLMHLAAGATAKNLNLRRNRIGPMWQRPFQCTIVESGEHLLNCLAYINLNMVRAGVVSHPKEWRWCSHDELAGTRKRYCILDIERLLESLGTGTEAQLRKWYLDTIKLRLEEDLKRDPAWTESVVVGSDAFVERTTKSYPRRRSFQTYQIDPTSNTWAVRETPTDG